MSQVTAAPSEGNRGALWPRGAVTPLPPEEEHRFVVSIADFSRQAKSWSFFRRLSIGYLSALYVFGHGAVSLKELL